jgi:hypothetical protein
VRWLVEHHAALVAARDLAWPALQKLLVAPGCAELVALERTQARAAGRSGVEADYARLMGRLPPEVLDPPPLVTGDDLAAHGIAPGKEYQRLLAAVREAQLTHQISTRAAALALVDRLRSS